MKNVTISDESLVTNVHLKSMTAKDSVPDLSRSVSRQARCGFAVGPGSINENDTSRPMKTSHEETSDEKQSDKTERENALVLPSTCQPSLVIESLLLRRLQIEDYMVLEASDDILVLVSPKHPTYLTEVDEMMKNLKKAAGLE